jgi:outer membrane protein assembly factor BamB
MARRRWFSFAATAASALVLSACWPVPGQNADRTARNALETALTPATVGGLSQRWASDPVEGSLRDPVVAGGGVVATTGLALHRFRGSTGDLAWSWNPGEPTGIVQAGDPFVVGDRLLVGYGYGNLGGQWQAALLDIATGTRTGQVDGAALTEGVRGTLAASTYYAFGSGTPVVVGYTLADVETGATEYGPLAVADTGGPAPSALTLGTERLYQSGSGVLAPAAPGEQQRFGLGVRAFPRSGVTKTCGPDSARSFACPLWAIEVGGTATAPVIGPGEQVVYVGTGAGTVVALAAADGTVLWTAPVGAAVVHPPALADGVLYVPTNAGEVVAVDANGCGAATCAPLWAASTGTAAIAGQPAVGGTGENAVLYAGTAGGELHAFAAGGCGEAACAPLWSASTGSPVTGGPIVSNGRVYAGLQDGRMVAYGLTAG